ncbi:hypothetical protein [Campylobacter lanienae]|uniref:hypothetical protein n=2 Tax=Campylobacter lanienae TaxID=75658 RepID=UPI00112FB851|nr:hypothetical protein [Campylobacter lanienae]
MKEKIIRFLRIILFDAFKSRWAWRRVPTQWYFKYMTSKRKLNIINTKLPPEYEMIYKKSADPFYKDTLVIVFSQGGFWSGGSYFKSNFIDIKYTSEYINTFLKSKCGYGNFNFLHHVDELVNFLTERIREFGYTRVIIFGGSSTGRAALLYSQILSGKCAFTQFYTIACAPVSDHSEKIYNISDTHIKENIENIRKYGPVDVLKHKLQLPRQNLFIYVIIGKFNQLDRKNAQSFSDCKYLKIFDDIKTHIHQVTFMMCLNHKYVEDGKKLFNLVSRLQGDDKIDENSDKAAEIVNEIFYQDGKSLQNFNILIDELITTGKITSLYK